MQSKKQQRFLRNLTFSRNIFKQMANQIPEKNEIRTCIHDFLNLNSRGSCKEKLEIWKKLMSYVYTAANLK